MTDWRDKIRNSECELCPLHESAEHVCLMGDGTREAKIMVIGEAPGAREDESHRAFVGPAGKLLDRMLAEQAQLNRADCYITNVAKCRPAKNRTPERKEIKTCVNEYLSAEIEAVDPDFILTLGNSALQGVVGRSGIKKHRGTVFDVNGYTVFPSFHPAAILRNPRLESELSADLLRFGRMVRGESSDLSTTVRVVRTRQNLKWLIRQLSKAKAITYDIETQGLDEWRPDVKIVSIAFTWEEGQAAFIPLHHNSSPWSDPDRVLRLLKPTLERTDCKYIAQNGKFDCRWLAAAGINVPQTFDTMLAAHMIDENRSKGLKNLSQLILGADAYGLGDELADAAAIKLPRLAIYNGKDTDYTHRLWQVFRRELAADQRSARIFQKLMMPASRALVDIERHGMLVDKDVYKQRYKQALINRHKLEQFMFKFVPKKKRADFNFNSHPQIGEWLFEDLDLPILERTKKGAVSSKESVLLQLQKEHVAVKALFKWRKWNKYITTYLSPWQEHMDENWRLHTNYKLFGTVTGRLASDKPNLQNVPRNNFIRNIIGAPEGWLFVQGDYSQIELRVAAMVAHEKRMQRMFAAGEDIHMNMAMAMTGKPAGKVTKEERKKAKAVNFGFLYGMGAEKFVTYARDNYDVDVDLNEATRVRDTFFQQFPALKPWHDRQRRLANRYGYVTSPLGRTRHLPDISSGDRSIRSDAERQAINSPVQSTASDLTLLALTLLHEHLDPEVSVIVGTVHDSILFEVREDVVDKVCAYIKDTMENLPTGRVFGWQPTVPVVADIEVSTHWQGTE